RWPFRVASIGGAKQDWRVHSEPRIAHPAAEAREGRGKAVHLVDDNNGRTCCPCQQDGFGLAKPGGGTAGEVAMSEPACMPTSTQLLVGTGALGAVLKAINPDHAGRRTGATAKLIRKP